MLLSYKLVIVARLLLRVDLGRLALMFTILFFCVVRSNRTDWVGSS